MSIISERINAGIFKENPIFAQVIGMCPTLAVSTSVENAVGMGIAATVVLIGSNIVISMLRKVIPDEIRIPAYITIIAAFVTVIQFLLAGYAPALNKSLGIFIPLIVVNCIILGRAEAYANKNSVIASFWDAVGMGLGFTVALVILGAIRELLGTGKLYGMQIMPDSFQPALIMILAPGAFFTLGIIMALIAKNNLKKAKNN